MAQRERDYAVIGLGQFGVSLALTLVREGHSVLGIDSDAMLVQRYADELTQAVSMDASDEEALRAVDIGSFNAVIVAIGTHFESSVMITITLKQMGVRHVICKALTHRQAEVLSRIGADRVILPEIEAGERLARELITPRLLDQMIMQPGYSVAEVRVPQALLGKTLAESPITSRLKLLLLAVKTGDELNVAPQDGYTFKDGDVLLVLGKNESIDKLSQGI